MANALNLLASGVNVSVAANAAINDLTSFTVLTLVRNGATIGTAQASIIRKRASALSTNTAGWRFDADNGLSPRAARFRIDHSTTDMSYRTNTATPLPFPAANSWRWVAQAVALGGSNGSRVRTYSSAFGGSFAETANASPAEPSGTRLSDAALPLLIGDTIEGPNAIAFVGIYPGQLTAAQLDAWVANMAGEAANTLLCVRLGRDGVDSAPDVGPNAIATTINGSPTLVTDAPEYWTSAVVADSLVFGTQPANTNVGSTMPAFTVRAVDSTDSNALDTSFTGMITLTPVGGSYTGTLAKVAVAGEATFNDIVPQTIGSSFEFEADASTFDTKTSDSFNITVPSGSGTILIQGGQSMQRALTDGETNAGRKTLVFDIFDDTANPAPWAGSVTGVKAQISINGAAPNPSTNDIARVATGSARHRVVLTDTEAAAAAPGDIITAWVAAASGRRESTPASFEVTAAPVYTAPETADTIADEVQTRGMSLASAERAAVVLATVRALNGLDGFGYERDEENNVIRITLPLTGVTTTPAVFADAAKAVTKVGS